MAYDPRTIAFFVELLHPPVQHDLKKLQTLHGDLFSDSRASYKNFSVQPFGVSFSNPQASQNSNSSLNFFQDRVQLREEFCSSGVDDVCARLEHITERAKEQCGIPIFTGEQCVVRSLVNPRQFRDSREFMAKGLLRFSEDNLSVFDRPTQLAGLRFVFPETQGQAGVFSIRMESYNGDPRSLYLENIGTFAPLFSAQDSKLLSDNLRATYDFLTERVTGFIQKFDRSEEKR